MDGNILLTDAQFTEWKLHPVTLRFMEYIRQKKYEINRAKMNIISGPVSQIDAGMLAELNGLEKTCNGILRLTAEELVTESNALKEQTSECKKMMKEMLGVDL